MYRNMKGDFLGIASYKYGSWEIPRYIVGYYFWNTNSVNQSKSKGLRAEKNSGISLKAENSNQRDYWWSS